MWLQQSQAQFAAAQELLQHNHAARTHVATIWQRLAVKGQQNTIGLPIIINGTYI